MQLFSDSAGGGTNIAPATGTATATKTPTTPTMVGSFWRSDDGESNWNKTALGG